PAGNGGRQFQGTVASRARPVARADRRSGMNGQERIGEAELRMALRGLRQDIEPGRDLWPGIAARIEALPRQAAPAARARGRWLWPVSMAASMLLAAGLAWQMRPASPESSTRQAQAV